MKLSMATAMQAKAMFKWNLLDDVPWPVADIAAPDMMNSPDGCRWKYDTWCLSSNASHGAASHPIFPANLLFSTLFCGVRCTDEFASRSTSES
jgi:hypothetical protein